MLQFKCSRRQMKAINNKHALAAEFENFKTMLRCQALKLYFEQEATFNKIADIVGKSTETVRLWVTNFLTNGVESLTIKKRAGRKSKLTNEEKKILKEVLSRPPNDSGFPQGGWNSALISSFIEERFGAKYSTKYLPEFLRNLGLSYQKAKYKAFAAVEDAKEEWIKETWPQVLAEASLDNAMILFIDESSFAMWGSLSYTWGVKGQQPIVMTSGSRKAYKMFGAIDYDTGKLFYKGIEGKLDSESYIEFLTEILEKTNQKIIIIHDGAPYHKSQCVEDFLATQERISCYRLPSYCPELNPIEHLWKKCKWMATHHIFFPTFDELVIRVESTMDYFYRCPSEILSLFGLYRKMKTLV